MIIGIDMSMDTIMAIDLAIGIDVSMDIRMGIRMDIRMGISMDIGIAMSMDIDIDIGRLCAGRVVAKKVGVRVRVQAV